MSDTRVNIDSRMLTFDELTYLIQQAGRESYLPLATGPGWARIDAPIEHWAYTALRQYREQKQ